jgi:hypothetical protein
MLTRRTAWGAINGGRGDHIECRCYKSAGDGDQRPEIPGYGQEHETYGPDEQRNSMVAKGGKPELDALWARGPLVNSLPR